MPLNLSLLLLGLGDIFVPYIKPIVMLCYSVFYFYHSSFAVLFPSPVSLSAHYNASS